jgi:hypothetical protein
MSEPIIVREDNPPPPVPPVPYWSYLVPIATATILMLQTLGLAWIAAKATQTADSVEKVHVAVNSERTAMMEKVDALHVELRKLAEANARLLQTASDKAKK